VKALVRTLLIGVATILVSYLVWDRVEVYRLKRHIQAIAARGEPVDLSSLDAPLPSASHQEAAQLYAEAAARARDIGETDGRMTRFDVDAVVGHVDVAGLEETYRKDTPALQLLDRAATLPFAGFGDAIDGPGWASATGLPALGGLAALRADLLAYRGEGDAAAAALASAISVQRTLPDLFSRFSVQMRQFGSLRILLRHTAPSAASLEALQRAFAGLPDEDGLDRDVMLRRARFIEQQTSEGPPGVSGWQALVFHPFLTRMARLQLEQFPAVIAAARESWPDKFATLSTLAAQDAPRANRSALRAALTGRALNLAALSAAPSQAGLILAARRVAVATLAIERYRRAHGGALPPSLEAVVPAFMPAVPIDPFSGRPIAFKPVGGGYFVYSVDTNRKDDGPTLYGTGSMNPMPLPKLRDFGIRVVEHGSVQ
jgi:hypothetical protein